MYHSVDEIRLFANSMARFRSLALPILRRLAHALFGSPRARRGRGNYPVSLGMGTSRGSAPRRSRGKSGFQPSSRSSTKRKGRSLLNSFELGRTNRDAFSVGLPTDVIAFSPDGQWLAAAVGGRISIFPIAGPDTAEVFGGESDDLRTVHFSGDGRRLLVAGNGAWVVEVGSRRQIGAFRYGSAPIGSGKPLVPPFSGDPRTRSAANVAALSPDGMQVALGGSFWAIERRDVLSGTVLSSLKLISETKPSSSSRVSFLAYAGTDHGQLAVVLSGRSIALVESDGTSTSLFQQPFSLRSGQREEFYQVFFTSDARELIVAAETLTLGKGAFDMVTEQTVGAEVQFWNLASRKVTRRFRKSSPNYFSQIWLSADERKLIALSHAYSRPPTYAAERQSEQLQVARRPSTLVMFQVAP